MPDADFSGKSREHYVTKDRNDFIPGRTSYSAGIWRSDKSDETTLNGIFVGDCKISPTIYFPRKRL